MKINNKKTRPTATGIPCREAGGGSSVVFGGKIGNCKHCLSQATEERVQDDDFIACCSDSSEAPFGVAHLNPKGSRWLTFATHIVICGDEVVAGQMQSDVRIRECCVPKVVLSTCFAYRSIWFHWHGVSLRMTQDCEMNKHILRYLVCVCQSVTKLLLVNSSIKFPDPHSILPKVTKVTFCTSPPQ